MLCVVDIYSIYTWIIPLKDEEGIIITSFFQKMLDKSNHRKANSKGRKPNKIRVDKDSEFYYRSMKSWLQENDIEIYSTHNEGKFVVSERFIRTFNDKIYKYMTYISKNVYVNKLDDLVNEYNNTYHSTIKIKPVEVRSNTYINSSKETNDKYPKFKIVILLDYENYFCKKLRSQLV